MEVEHRSWGEALQAAMGGGGGGGGGYLQVVLQHLPAVQEGGAGLAQVTQVDLRQTWEAEGLLLAAAPAN